MKSWLFINSTPKNIYAYFCPLNLNSVFIPTFAPGTAKKESAKWQIQGGLQGVGNPLFIGKFVIFMCKIDKKISSNVLASPFSEEPQLTPLLFSKCLDLALQHQVKIFCCCICSQYYQPLTPTALENPELHIWLCFYVFDLTRHQQSTNTDGIWDKLLTIFHRFVSHTHQSACHASTAWLLLFQLLRSLSHEYFQL